MKLSKEDKMLEELTKIREILTPAPPPPPPKGVVDEFKSFIKKYQVLGLAVAFIMGLYVGAVVQALVDDIIMPLVTLFMPDVAWEELVIGVFRIGHLIGTLITFLIVALVVFLIVKIATRIGID
jgi:large conductance mechanosensitive channel